MHTSKILSIKKVKCDKTPVYDIHVPGNNNFIVENGLVVHNCKPYQYFKNTLYEERMEIYDKCDLLTDEVLGLQRDNNSGKIDHDPSGINSKDQVDAVCGAIYNASQHAEEFAFDYGEDLEITQAISNGSGDPSLERNQITIDFEAEMMKLLDPLAGHEDSKHADHIEPKTNLSTNMYLHDGIIVF